MEDPRRRALAEANARFYRAIEELDLPGMDSLWLHESWVRCIHPGWDVIVGWDSIRESWERIFANTSWIRVTPTAVDVQVHGSVGMVGCTENITSPQDE